jgi:hypothetical protein
MEKPVHKCRVRPNEAAAAAAARVKSANRQTIKSLTAHSRSSGGGGGGDVISWQEAQTNFFFLTFMLLLLRLRCLRQIRRNLFQVCSEQRMLGLTDAIIISILRRVMWCSEGRIGTGCTTQNIYVLYQSYLCYLATMEEAAWEETAAVKNTTLLRQNRHVHARRRAGGLGAWHRFRWRQIFKYDTAI